MTAGGRDTERINMTRAGITTTEVINMTDGINMTVGIITDGIDVDGGIVTVTAIGGTEDQFGGARWISAGITRTPVCSACLSTMSLEM